MYVNDEFEDAKNKTKTLFHLKTLKTDLQPQK